MRFSGQFRSNNGGFSGGFLITPTPQSKQYNLTAAAHKALCSLRLMSVEGQTRSPNLGPSLLQIEFVSCARN